jgi:hypothetical protein
MFGGIALILGIVTLLDWLGGRQCSAASARTRDSSQFPGSSSEAP